MVAQKRGRGGKAAAAKAKPAEEVVEQPEATDAPAEDNNGETEPMEQAVADEPMEEQPEPTEEPQEATEETKVEEAKEEKIESGKILIENLPASYLFDFQDKLKELFSKHGEVTNVKRGPIIVTELTTTPTLSAIVEFKNKDSLEKALTEEGSVIEGNKITVMVESSADTAVLIGLPFEASSEYVKNLFAVCGEITQIHEFGKTKYKILRVTFQDKQSVEKALKLDRELRINGFLVTVTKYRDEEDQKQHNASAGKNKRQNTSQNNRNSTNSLNTSNNNLNNSRNNSFRGRGGGGGGGGGVGGGYNARGGQGNFRGGRGRGSFPTPRGVFPRGGFAGGLNNYMPPSYMPRPQGGYMNDGQRPNKRLRQM